MTKDDGERRPNPGSDEARALGCTCAVFDNHRGDEWIGRIRGFYITEGCPVHAPTPSENTDGR